MLIYVTGVPGTGKSTVCGELESRGYPALDADEADLCVWVSRDTGETLIDPPEFSARTPQFYADHIWRYDADKIQRLAAAHSEVVCFVGGFAVGPEEIMRLFTRAFFLEAGRDELTSRLLSRTNGPFANASDSQKAAQVQRVLSYRDTCDEAWRRDGLESVDASRSLKAVVDDILTRCDLPLDATSEAV